MRIQLRPHGPPKSDKGFVTPSHPGAINQGELKTPPSGEWVVYDSVASSDQAFQVLLVSVEDFTTLDGELCVCWHLSSDH